MQRLRLHVVERRHAVLGQDAAEVLDVERARQALAAQHRVVVELVRHTPVREDVRKVQLAARLQHAGYLLKHLILEGRQVDNAVRHHHVHRFVGNAERGQVLNEPAVKLHVGARKAEPLHLRRLVPPRESQLLLGHVHADDAPRRPHELRADIHVAPRAASQVEHRGTLQRRRDRRATPVEVRHDLVIDLVHHVNDVLRRCMRSAAASVRLEIIRTRKRLPIVFTHQLAYVPALIESHVKPSHFW